MQKASRHKATLAVILLILVLPWQAYLILLAIGTLFFKKYWEGVLIALTFDLFFLANFGTKDLFGVQSPMPIFSIVVLSVFVVRILTDRSSKQKGLY